jgi:aminomethyltransferase
MSVKSASLRRTPLYDSHVAAGARMVEFGGWDMPVQYSSILKEHAAVRTAAGLFDISHMGEIRVTGADAAQFLNQALTNNVDKVQPGNSQYSLLLNKNGGIIDDLFIYRMGNEDFLLVVNASHIEEDFEALSELMIGDEVITNESDVTAALALQGPQSPAILDRWISGASSQLGHHAIRSFSSAEGEVQVARTGYTGEDGFEILCPSDTAAAIWSKLLALGKDDGILPCGLGARDTLRMEVCYPLNGHELGPDITPLEAGLGFFIDFNKPDFQGKKALVEQKAKGVPRKAVALVAKEASAPPRASYPVLSQGRKIGGLTSGVLSPSLQKGIGLALIESASAQIGNVVDIEIRGKTVPAEIVKKPIYKKS